ncbi:MAG TPA: SDR family oxidoreductase [Candidatus Corynebacterium avicola]|uniref:SDR family oxidoreductase n=1 Tax=Candidatus Corynebacterium avicola TaxID=2838527 RepID=A0A9D1ULZ7_9CORY|nr:SDR family oxidoreductase [Candidatus Corynebacterium avicola]
MHDIVIIGGHGKVALLTAPMLVEAGNKVTSIIRSQEQSAAVRETGATPKVADIETMSTDDIAELLSGHDTVIWSAGAGGGNPERTKAVDLDAAIRTINAAEEVSVTRFIMVSWSGSYLDHGIAEDSSFYPYAEAKAIADNHLRESELDWTILGPSMLTDDPDTGGITVLPEGDGYTDATEVPRETVARTILATLECPQSSGVMIRFNAGDRDPHDALRSLW